MNVHQAPPDDSTSVRPAALMSANARDRVGILIVGMHRSGTSATTRIISLLGAGLPDNLMAPNSQFNPTGFWESNDVVKLNDELLMEANSHWDDVLPFNPAALPNSVLMSFQARAQSLLKQNFAANNCFVIKDPRISRVLPLWIDALQQQDAQVKIVIPLRHPMDVAASLTRRDGFSTEKSVYLWLRHMLDSVRYSQTLGYGIVIYDELLQDWRTGMKRLGEELALIWPVAMDSVAAQIDQFLAPELRHHTHTDSNRAAIGVIGEMAAKLYTALLRRSNELPAIIDAIDLELQTLEQVYTPLLRDHQRERRQNLEAAKSFEQQLHDKHQALADAYRHVQDLEQTLTTERDLYRHLDTEFNIKCEHLVLMNQELQQLRTQFQQLQAQMKDSANIRRDGKGWFSELGEVERLVQEKQAKYARQHEEYQQLLKQQRQCRNEISYAEAQLKLLKNLLLNN